MSGDLDPRDAFSHWSGKPAAPVSLPITSAIERAAAAYPEAYQKAVREAPSNRKSQGISRDDARKCYQAGIRAALAAALDTECHESVAREWGGDEEPCNAPVVGYRTDEEGPYPVCADHLRDPMVPLTVAILGATS